MPTNVNKLPSKQVIHPRCCNQKENIYHYTYYNGYQGSLNYHDYEWQQFYNSIKSGIPGTPCQKQTVMRKRILKFFNYITFDIDHYFTQRRDLCDTKNLKIIPNMLLLYGIDFMSINKLEERFASFNTTIDFCDDSHCIILFESNFQAKNALMKFIKDKNLIQNYQCQDNSNRLNENKFLKWIQLIPYYEFCFERKLWGRFMSTEDQQLQYQRSNLYYAYNKAKKQFYESAKIIDLSKQKKNRYSSCDNKRYSNSKSRSRSRSKRSHKKQDKIYDEEHNCRHCHLTCISNLRANKYQNQDKQHSPLKKFKRQKRSSNFIQETNKKFEQYCRERNKKIQQNDQQLKMKEFDIKQSTNSPQLSFERYLQKLRLDDSSYSQFIINLNESN